MTTTITSGSTSIFPLLVMNYKTERDARNVFHNVIGKAEPDVSLELDGTPYGKLELFFEYKADAWDAYTALSTGVPMELSDTDTPEVNMSFCRDGRMSLNLTSDRKRWILEIEYRETT